MKLHLGCGKLILPGYTNIDIISDKADIKHDITNLNFIEDNSVSEIYCSHVLEHIKRRDIINVLIEWNNKLKIDGILRIAVPDFESTCEEYVKNNNLSDLIGLLNGGQKDDYDIHYVNYDFKLLSELLLTVGFNQIERYCPHIFLNEYDDYSKSYLPHMDTNGRLMSLNIISKKFKNINKDDLILSKNINKLIKKQ